MIQPAMEMCWKHAEAWRQRGQPEGKRRVTVHQRWEEHGQDVVADQTELREWKEKTVTLNKEGGLLSFIHLKCKSREADMNRPTKCPPPPPFALEGLQGVCEGWGLWAGTAQAPLSQFKLPHIAEHVRAVSRGKANTHCPRSLSAAVCNKDENSSTKCWCVSLCFYTSLMQGDCSAGLKGQTLDQFCWHDWSRHQLWSSKKSFCIN